MAKVKLWVDGCAAPNPGSGGWGIVAIRDGQHREYSGSLEVTTNNRAELAAIVKGLQILTQPGDEITIHTDSRYCVGVLSMGWRVKANKDLIWSVLQASIDRKVRYLWIKSEDNWRADVLSHGVS